MNSHLSYKSRCLAILYLQAFFVFLVSFGEFRICQGEDLDGEQSSVFSAVNSHASNRYAWRHLCDGEEGVSSAQTAGGDGDTDDGQSTVRSDHTGQMSSHSGAGDDDAKAFMFGFLCQLGSLFRIAVSATDVKIGSNAEFIQGFLDWAADFDIALATQDDADFLHKLFSSIGAVRAVWISSAFEALRKLSSTPGFIISLEI